MPPRSLLAACLLLAACGEAAGNVPVKERDPMVEQALYDDLMTDPDLAGSNEANAALTGAIDHSLPPVNATPEAVTAAREEAAQLVGGASRMRSLPEPRAVAGEIPVAAAFSAAARAELVPGAAECASRLEYTAAWAARMPEALPVYPRGATQEAAGTDEEGCALRVVNFLTPVPLEEVIGFYFTRARAANYSTRHSLRGSDIILDGVAANGARYAIFARTREDGLTEVDLVTLG